MRLLRFLERESSESYKGILFFTIISGLANTLLLTVINHAADRVAANSPLTQYFVIYLIAFVLFMYTQWFAFGRAIRAIEEALRSLRIRLTDKIRTVDLLFIEGNTERGDIYTRLTQENALMSQAVPQLTAAAQAALLALFSALYLGTISPLALVIFFVFIVISTGYFMSQNATVRASLARVVESEGRYFNSLSHLIEGFKEIKVNQRKNDDIFEEIRLSSRRAEATKVDVGHVEMKIWGFGKNAVYVLLPLFVFILPDIEDEYAADVYKTSATLLFISGPITLLIATLPLLNRINVFLDGIFDLEAELDRQIHGRTAPGEARLPAFRRIRLEQVHFRYPARNGQTPFTAGPFDVEVQAGEILFIVGGNGSGKSTFLKVLTGLYQPQTGRLSYNGQPIDDENYQAYRESFSIIFTDFHLFGRIYGIPDLDPQDVDHWLKKMRVEHKTAFRDGEFTNINLSTGQRKRLAFIAAILEQRPILVLDEFAADQDPGFRRYFYETLLPELKAMGKTIIAVSHDDHYFHVADRVLKMDLGRISEYSAS
jgi:putative ATP-binding cassette transporter